jgi:outer membrane receptor protein involved in Fe transport
MYYYRTNRKLIGSRNAAAPRSAYTEQSIAVPGPPAGPGGTITFYNLLPAFNGLQDNVFDNQDALDTTYHGVELSASKRLSDRWQLLAGVTFGKNEGGVLTGDLNDPNNELNFPQGIEGTDSAYALRVSGTYLAPYDINVSGSFVMNDGYPYQSVFGVTRTAFPSLTRSTQNVRLTERGVERLPDVAMIDLRFSRTFRLGGRRLTPLLEVFNLTNADTIVGYNANVGTSYLLPTEILSPRLVRFGVMVDF